MHWYQQGCNFIPSISQAKLWSFPFMRRHHINTCHWATVFFVLQAQDSFCVKGNGFCTLLVFYLVCFSSWVLFLKCWCLFFDSGNMRVAQGTDKKTERKPGWRHGGMVSYKQVAGLHCIAREGQKEKLTEEAVMVAWEARKQGDDQRGRLKNLKKGGRERGPNWKALGELSGNYERDQRPVRSSFYHGELTVYLSCWDKYCRNHTRMISGNREARAMQHATDSNVVGELEE